jgi:hypothetical protein
MPQQGNGSVSRRPPARGRQVVQRNGQLAHQPAQDNTSRDSLGRPGSGSGPGLPGRVWPRHADGWLRGNFSRAGVNGNGIRSALANRAATTDFNASAASDRDAAAAGRAVDNNAAGTNIDLRSTADAGAAAYAAARSIQHHAGRYADAAGLTVAS